MHFVDNLEADSNKEWEEFFHDTKVVGDDETVAHPSKFGIVEDRFNS